MLIDTQRQMDGLGDATDSLNGNQQGAVLLRMLSNFAAKFSDAIAGKGNVGGETVEMSELYGGARISFIFNDVFGRRLKALDPFEGLDDEDIRTAIANANGPRPSLFVPEQSFDLLVRRQVGFYHPSIHPSAHTNKHTHTHTHTHNAHSRTLSMCPACLYITSSP